MMKIKCAAILLVLWACGKETRTEVRTESCSVERVEKGARVYCDNGTEAIVPDGKVVKVKPQLIYRGVYCGRTVVSLGNKWFVFHHELSPLNDKWVVVSKKCSVRRVKGKIEVNAS